MHTTRYSHTHLYTCTMFPRAVTEAKATQGGATTLTASMDQASNMQAMGTRRGRHMPETPSFARAEPSLASFVDRDGVQVRTHVRGCIYGPPGE